MNKEIILTGTVVHGKALGRTVGMPTANLRVDEGCVLPEAGVYATVSEIDGKKQRKGSLMASFLCLVLLMIRIEEY